MAKYYGMVKCIDDNVGKILDTLRTKNLVDNTIVVFTSDHGDLRAEHHRQNKGVPFEASAKVPFIVYYPAKIKAGTVINEALGCVDFLPTIINLMGFKTLGTEEGRDASELLTTGKAPSGWTDITFFRGTGNGKGVNGWVAAVTDRCKLIYSPVDDPWLFDLEKDPDEMINQFTNPDYRQTVRTLSGLLLEYGKKYNDPCILAEKIAADLKWATGDEAGYKPSQAGESGVKTTPAKRQKKAAASKRKQNQARVSR
jgi:uncharacterized sulfatase